MSNKRIGRDVVGHVQEDHRYPVWELGMTSIVREKFLTDRFNIGPLKNAEDVFSVEIRSYRRRVSTKT